MAISRHCGTTWIFSKINAFQVKSKKRIKSLLLPFNFLLLPSPRRAAQQTKQFVRNFLEMLQQKVHQRQMAQIVRRGTAIVATAREPALNGGHGTRTDGGDEFVSDLPFGIELFGCHS
jgi:hypothetical protein